MRAHQILLALINFSTSTLSQKNSILAQNKFSEQSIIFILILSVILLLYVSKLYQLITLHRSSPILEPSLLTRKPQTLKNKFFVRLLLIFLTLFQTHIKATNRLL